MGGAWRHGYRTVVTVAMLRGVDSISNALPFGRPWYDTSDNAIGYALHSSRSHDAEIRVYDAAGNVIETHEHKGRFKDC